MEMEGINEGTMKLTSAVGTGLSPVFIGHLVIQINEDGGLIQRFLELTLCRKCNFNHSTLSKCKNCAVKYCGGCWGLQEAGSGIKCPGCSQYYNCIDKENAPTLVEYLNEETYREALRMDCPFCDGEELHIVSIKDDKLNEGKGESLGWCGLSFITKRSKTKDTILMANLIEHVATHLNQKQKGLIKSGEFIVTNLSLATQWPRQLILSVNISGKIKAANEKALPAAMAQRPASVLESSPSKSIHQQSDHSNDQPETHAAKKQCLQNYDVVSYLNIPENPVKDKNQDGSISKNKMSDSIPFYIKDFSYMTRPVSFQDVDHRMILTIKELHFTCPDSCKRAYNILGLVGRRGAGFPWIISQHILRSKNIGFNRVGNDLTLKKLHSILKPTREASVVDDAFAVPKEIAHKPKVTNDVSILNILSKSWTELSSIVGDLCIDSINIKAIEWGLEHGKEVFFIFLFHMVCQPKDSKLIDWIDSDGDNWDYDAALEYALDIYKNLKDQDRPVGVLYEALQHTGLYGGFHWQLKLWVADNNIM